MSAVNYDLCDRLCLDAVFYLSIVLEEMEKEVRLVDPVEASILDGVVMEMQEGDSWPLDFLHTAARSLRRLNASPVWLASEYAKTPITPLSYWSVEAALASVGSAAYLAHEHPLQVKVCGVDTRLDARDRSHLSDAATRCAQRSGAGLEDPLFDAETKRREKAQAYDGRHSLVLEIVALITELGPQFDWRMSAKGCFEHGWLWSEASTAWEIG